MADIKKTECSDCGKSIKYKTKKPKRCTVCRTTKSKKRTKKKTGGGNHPGNKNTQGELILFSALDKFLGSYEYINHGYFSILKSPKGYPMQLDRYYPELKLAWEFDGKQHEEYNRYIHGSKKNFDYYKKCDKLKEELCKKHGITLIRIAWNYKITEDALKQDILKASKKLHSKIFGGR